MRLRTKDGIERILVAFGCSLFVMMMPVGVFAASIGNPIEPVGELFEPVKVAAGLEYNVITEKDIEATGDFSSMELERANQVYVKLSMGLTDKLNVYTKLGLSDLEQDIRFTSGNHYEVNSDPGLLLGVGANYSYEFYEDWRLGMDLQFNAWKADVDEVTLNEEIASNISGEVENKELQASLYVSKRLELPGAHLIIVPYLGGKYTLFKTESDGQINYAVAAGSGAINWSLEGEDKFGLILGSELFFYEALSLGLEGRFIDETAVTLALVYRLD